MVTPVLVVTSIHADVPIYILPSALLQVLCPDMDDRHVEQTKGAAY